jgi:hypothetical protein
MLNPSVACAFREILFPDFPDHDCIWDVCRAADGMIYFSLCSEGRATTAQLMRFDPATEKVEWVLDVGEVTGDRMCQGKIPQSKIHTTMCPAANGMLYFATHCTAPPPGEELFETIGTYGNPDYGFTGSFLLSYDTRTGRSESLGLIAPFQGLRIMVLDERRRVLYGITYPKHHLHQFELEHRRFRDLGRIGNLGSFGLFMDRRGRVFGTNDAGFLWRYDPEPGRIEELGLRLPKSPGRESPYNFLWYAVEGPQDWIYGSTYYDGMLFRYHPELSEKGCIEDLGPGLHDDRMLERWAAPYIQAPVFDFRERLWYGVSPIWEPVHLVCMDQGNKIDLGELTLNGLTSAFLAESAATADGRKLVFGDITMTGRPRLLIFDLDCLTRDSK